VGDEDRKLKRVGTLEREKPTLPFFNTLKYRLEAVPALIGNGTL
jgi:hypothetical protein